MWPKRAQRAQNPYTVAFEANCASTTIDLEIKTVVMLYARKLWSLYTLYSAVNHFAPSWSVPSGRHVSLETSQYCGLLLPAFVYKNTNVAHLRLSLARSVMRNECWGRSRLTAP